MSCINNSSDINQTFIIEPLSITGGSPTISACTSLYTDSIVSCSGDTTIFMGNGIINFDGNIFTNDDLSASTINASTYFSGGTNLLNIINSENITGGTFSNLTDTLKLFKLNGDLINITGFSDYYTTGSTLIGSTVYFNRNDMLSAYTVDLSSLVSSSDKFITGFTFNNNQLIITRNDNVNFNVLINTFTGLTINGLLTTNIISATTISATTYYGNGSNLTGIQDIRITGGTYSNGTAIFINNTGGTFNVSGFTTGNTYITGGTLNVNTLQLKRNDDVQINVDLTDIRFSGGSAHCITDIYFTNVHGCSPITFHDTMRGLSGLTVTGFTISDNVSATTINANSILSGSTNLSNIFLKQDNDFIENKILVGISGNVNFTSIYDAVNSITGATNENRFVINVGPGTYIEPMIDLSNKPYVSIVGDSIQTTVVMPDSNSHHIFSLGLLNELSFMWLEGSGLGYAGIAVLDSGDYSQAHKITFNNCDIGILVTASTQDTVFYGEYLDCNGAYSFGTKVIATNGFRAFVNLENYYNLPTETGDTIGTYISGLGAQVDVLASGNVGVGYGTCIYVQNNGIFNGISTNIDSWDVAINIANVGDGSIVRCDSIFIINSTNFDLSVNHPTSELTFQGILDDTKLFINDLATVSIVFQDSVSNDFNISGKLNLRFSGGVTTDISTAIIESSTMGVYNGGVLSINSGLVINISEGFGYLELFPDNEILKKITWNDTTLSLGPNTENYIFFNYNGILSSSGSRPNTIYNILLGRVVTNSTNILFIDSSPLNAAHTSNRNSNFTRDALGSIYVSGSIVIENTGSTLNLNVTQGNYYFGENNFLPSGGTNISMTAFYMDGAGGFNTTGITFVDSTHYDNGSGSLVSLSGDYYTKHSLYLIENKYFMVYGQSQYSALTVVEQADISTTPTYFSDGVVLIAGLIVKQGSSYIIEIQDLRPVIGFKAPGVSASSFHGNLLGLGNDDHTQYLLVNGSRAMNGDLDIGNNNIISANTINGVIIQTHASRHLPNGTDPLTTGVPSNIGGVNSEGIQNALSRQDHIHAHGSQSGGTSHSLVDNSNAGFMSSNDKIYFDTIPTIFNTKASLSGATFTGGLTVPTISATTISATTYQNLPIDVRVTGGTYSNGTAIFTNNTGGTFSVSGLFTGNTEIFITGGTPNNSSKIYTFSNNTGGTFSVTALTDILVTGGTYSNGITTFTNNTGGTFSVSGFFTGATDITITGGTYSNGTTVFTNNTGGTFSVSGFSTGGTSTDTYVTGGTPNNSSKIYTFSNNTGGTFTVTGLTDITITGGTYSAGTAVFTNNTGGTFSVSGLFTGGTDVFVTGGTSNDNSKIYTFTNNTGGTFSVSALTDIRITGGTFNALNRVASFTNNTGGTFSVSGFSDILVTGGTYSNGTAVFTNNTGGTFSVSGLFTGNTEIFITGGTPNNSSKIYTFSNNTGGTFSVTALTDINITGFSYNNANNFTLINNTGGTFSVLVNTMSGLTINGSLSATTYLGLPIDVRVTGGTYSNGTAIFTNNTGGTFSVNGFSSGGGGDSITGGTYNNLTGTLTLNTTGSSITITGFTTGSSSTFTGGTVTGATNFTGGLTASTYYGDGSNLTGITHTFTGTTTLDFGARISFEDSYTTTAITNSNILSTSQVIFRITPSNDHNEIEDSVLEGLILSTSDIVNGIGFNLNAFAMNDTWGIYNVFYKIIN